MDVSIVTTLGSISKVLVLLLEKKGRLEDRKSERIPQRIHCLITRVSPSCELIGQCPLSWSRTQSPLNSSLLPLCFDGSRERFA